MKRGFTLIELLVVIAIIGILSAVVLASLNTARQKGNDAAIKADLGSVRTQAALYYDDHNGTYNSGAAAVGPDCTSSASEDLLDDSRIAQQIAAAETANGTTSVVVCNIADDGTAYAVSSPLVTDPLSYYCVDSVGAGMVTATALGTDTFCTAS